MWAWGLGLDVDLSIDVASCEVVEFDCQEFAPFIHIQDLGFIC